MDLKARIIAEFEATGGGPHAVSQTLGCSYEYTMLVLRTYRGDDDHRIAVGLQDSHRKHLAGCIRAGGFPWLVRRAA